MYVQNRIARQTESRNFENLLTLNLNYSYLKMDYLHPLKHLQSIPNLQQRRRRIQQCQNLITTTVTTINQSPLVSQNEGEGGYGLRINIYEEL